MSEFEGFGITELEVGQTAEITRLVDENTVRQFAEVSGDFNPLHMDEAYAAPAYGIPSAETVAAIRLAARLEGLLTDPVYEGKSMQALIDKVRKGVFPAGSKILYVHLGGAPALDAYWTAFAQGEQS